MSPPRAAVGPVAGLLAALLAAPGVAHASACCVGTVSDQPAQLGRCERLGAALAVGSAVELGSFDGQGRWGATSDGWVQSTATLGVAARWARWGSASLSLPVVLSAREAPGLASVGGGVGDLALSARIEPWEEGTSPRPTFSVGLVAPTGRGWADAEDPLGADVTGAGAWSPVAGVALERTGGAWPWRVGVEGILPLGPDDAADDAADDGDGGGLDAGTLVASASVGRYFGSRWTLTGALSARVEAAPGGVGARPALDLRLVHGAPRSWRAWVGVGSDLPLVGVSAHGEARVGAGFLVVR